MVQNNKDMQSFSSKFCKSCHKIQPSGEGILHYTNKKFMNNVYIPFISYDIGISKTKVHNQNFLPYNISSFPANPNNYFPCTQNL